MSVSALCPSLADSRLVRLRDVLVTEVERRFAAERTREGSKTGSSPDERTAAFFTP